MHTILSVLAAIVGSAAGNAVRAGVDLATERLNGRTSPSEPMMVNGSLIAGVASGFVVSTVGGGAGLAFWVGAVLGAAGADRLDWIVLRQFGLDREKLMAQARRAADQAGQQAREMAQQAREATQRHPEAEEGAEAGEGA